MLNVASCQATGLVTLHVKKEVIDLVHQFIDRGHFLQVLCFFEARDVRIRQQGGDEFASLFTDSDLVLQITASSNHVISALPSRH